MVEMAFFVNGPDPEKLAVALCPTTWPSPNVSGEGAGDGGSRWPSIAVVER